MRQASMHLKLFQPPGDSTDGDIGLRGGARTISRCSCPAMQYRLAFAGKWVFAWRRQARRGRIDAGTWISAVLLPPSVSLILRHQPREAVVYLQFLTLVKVGTA
jgi:hypothetical protein